MLEANLLYKLEKVQSKFNRKRLRVREVSSILDEDNPFLPDDDIAPESAPLEAQLFWANVAGLERSGVHLDHSTIPSLIALDLREV